MEINTNLWISTYKSNEQLWLIDSLNWEKVSNIVYSETSVLSWFFNLFFSSNHLITDYIVNITNLDILNLLSNSVELEKFKLFNFFFLDLDLLLNQIAPYFLNLINFGYQNVNSINLLINPEVYLIVYDYYVNYYFTSTIFTKPVVVYDSYINNLNFLSTNGALNFYFFVFFTWFILYLFVSSSLLKWHNYYNFAAVRVYYYTYSFAKDTRIQFETVLSFVVMLIFYWLMTVMTFDDDQEEFIEYVHTSFFYIFTLIVLYLVYAYSIHYFAFLDATATNRRTVSFVAKQFSTDFLNTFSLLLRFYILLFRINIYDTLEDFFDSYYILVGDFDDDEYLNELFFSIHGTLFFTLDNNDDRSFLLEDENDFYYDLYYLYFMVWGKFFYFLIFTCEEGGRLGLALYICYLITFEVHTVNASYKEDNYFTNKKNLLKNNF